MHPRMTEQSSSCPRSSDTEGSIAGSQDFAEDPRNAGVKIYLNGAFVPREKATVSIFDAGWILGDGIWEGLRMHGGRLAFLQRHLDRLFMGARVRIDNRR